MAVGDFISGEGHVGCGRCHACRTGASHICENLQVIGIDRDGAFADYVVMPPLTRGGSTPASRAIVAAIMDPMGNAVHAAFETSLVTRRVLVTGCGPIGLMVVAICQIAGAAFVAANGHFDRTPRSGPPNGR